MTIQVELSPDAEARLAAEAEAYGIAPARHAESLLEALLVSREQEFGKLSVSELQAMLHQIAEGSEALPKLPSSVFTRESFYEDPLQ